jgi:type I restriction enzyme S subunit
MMDENLPELPEGWVWTKLGEIAGKLKAGGTPLTRIKKFYENGTIPFVKIEDMVNANKYLHETLSKITEDGLNNSSAWLVPENSLLYSMYASYGIPVISKAEIATNQAIIAFLTPGDLVYLDYVFYYLLSIKPILQMYIRGTTQDNLNAAIVSSLPIPLPPLPEQQRIVTKIEELFTELDAGTKALKKVKAQLKRYRQAVLKYAFEGNLTEEWREMHSEELEPASVLLERVFRERQKKWEEAEFSKMKRNNKVPKNEKWKNAYKNPLESNNRFDIKLPRGWNWTNLDTLTYFTIDYRGKTPPTAEEGILMISAANVKNGKIVMDKPRFVSQGTYNRWTTRGLPEPGDLIITTEAPVGEAALYPHGETYLLTRRVLACQTLGVRNQYLLYFFYSELAKKYLDKQSRGTTVPRILKPILLSMPVSLPPILEQDKIVKEIEKRYSIADEIEKTVEHTLKQAERLRQSILKKAFEGKLVPQNPNDEPAHLLLERIKAEKAKKTKKSRKKSEKYEQKRLIKDDN